MFSNRNVRALKSTCNHQASTRQPNAPSWICAGLVGLVLTSGVLAQSAATQPALPVSPPEQQHYNGGIRNLVTFEQIHNIVGVTPNGHDFLIDLADASLSGRIYTGPYPFEAAESDFDYARFRESSELKRGAGKIDASGFFRHETINANDWPKDYMTVAYRLALFRDERNSEGHLTESRPLGFYDSLVSFTHEDGRIAKTVTIVEGPLLSMVEPHETDSVTIAWVTDEACIGKVYLAGPVANQHTDADFQLAGTSARGTRHEIRITGLEASRQYVYYVRCEGDDGKVFETGQYHFRNRPEPGTGEFSFAFCSDSREGRGGGERNYMGHNKLTLEQIVRHAYRHDASFFLFGGDLVNGYTSQPQDFTLQLRGWKQSFAGYWRTRPVYTAMGNHDCLLNVFSDDDGYVLMDKWPYATLSAEAIWAREFLNPTNGPEPADQRRPPYMENVHSFQYGPVLSIAYNNNYWWTTNHKTLEVGGSPEGYLLDDQLTWIEQQLQQAENDPSIRFILLYAQEPVFPCGGHVGDAMWWNGNNQWRAGTFNDDTGEVEPASAGMIEVRDRFWTAVAKSSKVAAVLAGDEHTYYRLRVDDQTPVGVYPDDDENQDGILETYSANPAFTHPTWHITAGTGGAPYYARQYTPWEPEFVSSQAGYCLFTVKGDRLAMTYYTITGQPLDHIPDLMAIKKQDSR